MKNPKIKALAFVFCLGVAVMVGAWFFGGEDTQADPPARDHLQARGTVATLENMHEVFTQTEEQRRFNRYEASMSIDWEFETSRSPSNNVFVENLPTNPGTVFFDLVLPETGELLFSSPYIPLGGILDSITLDVDLPPGVYHPHVIYHLVDEDNEVRATVTVGVTMSILN